MKFKAIKPSFTVFTIPIIFFAFFVLIAFLFIKEHQIIGLVMIIVSLPIFYRIIDGFIFHRIIINEQGVEYITIRNRYFLKWEEIGIIGIGRSFAR